MLPAYAELHCLSNFSFLRGASHPEELVERAHAQGYAALAITDECSLCGVVRAHLAAKACGLKLVIGSEFTLADGVKLVLLAPDRASYGNLAQLITRGRRSAVKGRYTLTRADVAAQADGLLALWVPPADLAASGVLAIARWVATTFPDRGWIAVELAVRAGERTRLHELAALSRESGLPQAAAGDVHMHARARRALQDTLTAVRLRAPLAECGYALFPNGERHLRSRARLATIYPPAVAGRDDRHRRSLHVFVRRAALRISGGNRAAGGNAGIAPAQTGRGRAAAAVSAARPLTPTSAS